ncbi:hypothetical protein GCM10023169_13970 [Georgenia halophila]|uniref:Endonuclease/exonuclease/phosphatase domain-containing protein n=1 Tax=Georgenia halophila TaxID=620889 RepID=A0ABP8L2Y8_9MICO
MLTLGVALMLGPVADTAGATPSRSHGGTLRVMTWNVHYGAPQGGDDVADLERIAAVIRSESPDVVTLNEVHDDEDFPGGHGHQPKRLAALLADDGYRYTFYDTSEEFTPEGSGTDDSPGCGSHAPPQSFSCGNMVLSRFPIYLDPDDPRAPKHVTLPTEHAHPDGRPRRGLLGVTVKVPGVGDVRVFVAHLSAPATEQHVADQKDQVRTILEHVQPVGEPMILAGDLNIRPSDAPEGAMANSLIRSWIADAGLVDTWTRGHDSSDGVTVARSHGRPGGEHPDRRIDFVYASPSFDIRYGHVSLLDPAASDHLPVVMDLQLRTLSLDAHASVLAGEDGLSGWSQVAIDRGNRVSLTACKNVGTDTDDGSVVRATLRDPSADQPIASVEDGGTSRDRCTTQTWKGTVRAETVLESCVVHGDEVLSCRRETIGPATPLA